LSTFKKYSEPEPQPTEVFFEENKQKKDFLLNQMDKILNQLTTTSTSTLNTVTATIIEQKKSERVDGVGPSVKKASEAGTDISQPFRSKLVVCSRCDGELFIV